MYFVHFAKAYLLGMPEFDAHPPLGKYLIALGIWISTHLSSFSSWFASSWPATDVAAVSSLSPIHYRWMNALVGSCIPLVVMAIAHSLSMQASDAKEIQAPNASRPNEAKLYSSKRWTFVLLSSVFVAIDGLFVVESRYGLLNVYLVFWGLLSHWLWLQSRFFSDQKNIIKARLLRILAGIALGAAVATKWNGLGYALSLWVWESWRPKKETQGETKGTGTNRSFFQWKYILYGLFIPGIVYGLTWWPHLWLTGERFVDVHATLLNFHIQLGGEGHSACSRWYTWPLLIKPFPYWYEEAGASVHTVNNMGNPLLWWLSSAAMMLLVIEGIGRLKDKWLLRRAEAFRMTDLSLYLVIGYVSNWLPWVLISRCTYIYLYMPAAVFSFMVSAWLLSEWLHSPVRKVRAIGWIVLGAIALAAWFWLPLALGSPLSPEGLRMRWWLRSWI